MSKREEIMKMIGDEELPVLFADDFDDAIIGFCEKSNRVIYNRQKIIDIMVDRDEMTYEEAVEYYDFNILGAYVGEYTPIYANLIE